MLMLFEQLVEINPDNVLVLLRDYLYNHFPEWYRRATLESHEKIVWVTEKREIVEGEGYFWEIGAEDEPPKLKKLFGKRKGRSFSLPISAKLYRHEDNGGNVLVADDVVIALVSVLPIGVRTRIQISTYYDTPSVVRLLKELGEHILKETDNQDATVRRPRDESASPARSDGGQMSATLTVKQLFKNVIARFHLGWLIATIIFIILGILVINMFPQWIWSPPGILLWIAAIIGLFANARSLLKRD